MWTTSTYFTFFGSLTALFLVFFASSIGNVLFLKFLLIFITAISVLYFPTFCQSWSSYKRFLNISNSSNNHASKKRFNFQEESSHSFTHVYKHKISQKPRLVLLILVLLLQVLAVFMPFFMSDDVLRHIHDGFYLLKGIDVYKTPPVDLPLVLDLLPNHPHLGSIYLPSTQLIAYLGSMIDSKYGFLILFHSLCFFLIVFYYFLCKDSHFLFLLLISPWLIFVASGHHADYLGMLIVFCCLGILQNRTKIKNLEKSKFYFYGILIVILPGLKPEGLIWALFLFLWFVLKNKNNRKNLIQMTFAGFFMGALLFLFSIFYMWPNGDSFSAFLKTAQVFSELFLAYNPIPDLMRLLFDFNHKQGIFYSKFLVTSITLIIAMLYYWKNIKRNIKAKSLSDSALSRPNKGRFLIHSTKIMFIFLLLISLLHKGTWHPWYFVWFLPLIMIYRKILIKYSLLVAGMPLFYLPVVDFRLTGLWDMSEFYLAIMVYLLFILVFWRKLKLEPTQSESFKTRYQR